MQDLFRVSVDLSKPEMLFSTSWCLLLASMVLAVALVLARRHYAKKRGQKSRLPLRTIKVTLKLPGTEIEGTWEPDEAERRAAWELYVELVTRTTVVQLKDGEGRLREVLTSYHTLFETTRKILRHYGPSIALPKASGKVSFGHLAVPVLNLVLRPVLSHWHPLLTDWESRRGEETSPVEHENQWPHNEELRQAIRKVQQVLDHYARILEEVADIPPLI